MLDSALFQTYPLNSVRAITIFHDVLIINCYCQEQADEILDLADEIAEAVPKLNRVRMSIRGQFAFGFPVHLLPRRSKRS